MRDQLGEHGGLVAGAGPDLQHAVRALEVEQVGRQRDDVRLRDRLAVADRQRPVLVGLPGHRRRHEPMPLDAPHRRHDARRELRATGLAPGLAGHRRDLVDHPIAKPLGGIGGGCLRGSGREPERETGAGRGVHGTACTFAKAQKP